MKRSDLILRVRSYTRDFSNSIFREQDIIDYINEGIDRIKQVVPEFAGMVSLDTNDAVPLLIPSQYHSLLAVYSTSRCFAQDERHYQASTYMNEFEQKLEELLQKIQSGDVVIVDENGVPVVVTLTTDYVVDNYFTKKDGLIDIDEGVEGVQA